jgi:translation initiation factor 3 subunit F
MVSNNLNELPNLNFGMQVKQLQCSIHPTIVSNILDHYMRRPQNEQTVVGTLLGSVDGQIVDLQTCFSIPTETNAKKNVVIDDQYL